MQKQEAAKKVPALIKQMTLAEKIAQLNCYWIYDLQSKGKLDSGKVTSLLANGIGQITRIGGASTLPPQEAAMTANQIQKFLREETRLGIPAIVHEECCAGLMVTGGSIFPQMIGLASTFQPELAKKMTHEISKQSRAIGAHQGLAPVLDVGRDPRWGRIEETFGEDPLLVSQFGVAYIQGLQGDDLSQGVMATGKHFIGHSFSQGGLNCGPVHLGQRDLWETYMGPFQAAIRDAGLATMMNAYPELDGEVVAASRRILTDLLRNQLGFDGPVVSDYEAVVMIHNYHSMAATKHQAAALALQAGIDVEMPTVDCYGTELVKALELGEISLEDIDLAVSRHLQKKFELGLFENPFVSEDCVLGSFETKEQRELAYEIACQSLVLLKNEGTLPISKSTPTLAVIGPNAADLRCMQGDYSYSAVRELLANMPPQDSNFVGLTAKELGTPSVQIRSVLDEIKAIVDAKTQVFHARGCEVNSTDESGFSEAIQAAKKADQIILVLGGKSGLAPDCTTGEFRDTTDLGLPGVQEKLALQIMDLGKPVVLVLLNGRPTSIPVLADRSNAILEAWVPGEEGAKAIAKAIFGEVNPGGKLPVTIARSAGQVPVFYNFKPSGMRSNIYGDYCNEPVRPLFSFGYGLSYTSFEYSGFQMGADQVEVNQTIQISCDVKNVGALTGDEVVQLYCRDVYGSSPRPVKELKGFVRISLDPGETRRVSFELPVNLLAFYNLDLKLVVEPGTIEVMIGSSSDDIRLRGSFEISGKEPQLVEKRLFNCPVRLT